MKQSTISLIACAKVIISPCPKYNIPCTLAHGKSLPVVRPYLFAVTFVFFDAAADLFCTRGVASGGDGPLFFGVAGVRPAVLVPIVFSWIGILKQKNIISLALL